MTPPATASARPFYGKPYAWIVFALFLLAVPLVGYMVQAGLRWDEMHPAINAMLNGSSTVFLTAGGLAIRRRQIALHRACMISAFVASSLFLASYLTRYAISGTHLYPGHGWDRTLYMGILLSHMALAMALLPLSVRTLHLAWRGRFDDHRRIARWTWPIWMYVSVTGVLVYLMLYPIAAALHP